MTSGHFGQTGIYIAGCVLAVMAAVAPVQAQSHEQASAASGHGTVQGRVLDFTGTPVANVAVVLQIATGEPTPTTPGQVTHTDIEGKYHFAVLQDGVYTLRAEGSGYGDAIVGPLSLAQ